MKNTSSFILGLVVILLIAGATYTYFGKKTAEAPVTQNEITNSGDTNTTTGTTTGTDISIDTSVEVNPTATTVTYNDSGFSPSTVKIKVGEKVIFVNNSSGKMWVASNEHPSHALYNGTDRQSHCPDTTQVAFDQCEDGKTYTFTFNKAGGWDYHNHLLANKVGMVIVE